MYIRKKKTYFENHIYNFAQISDLRPDLIDLARKMAVNNNPNHPWGRMNDLDLLKSASLYDYDFETGVEGINLAGILIFGRDEVIQSVLPYYRIDALLRVWDEERFDDRDLIRTNLIESYFRLFQFISKHLPDPFYLEGDVRKSVRDIIARELCVNLVIHREYSNPYITRLVISKNELMTENANRPRMIGYIDVHDFVPYPKNPIIAKFFNEIGLADELGSGIKKIAKYVQVYSKDFPTFKEADIFTVKIPLHCFDSTTQVTTQVEFSGKYENIIMHFCEFAKSSREIREYIGIKNQRYFMKSILNPMVQKGLIVLTIPDKPRSSKQKYIVKK